ncbi:MAG: 6,7-dimethyl-8-ribityllumazine synthase, partial [Bacteroidota bacterium]
IVVSEWHNNITHKLYEGCFDTLVKHGAKEDNIHVVQVPGSFELPAGARLLATQHKLDAVICIGCVIQGETKHNEYINNAVAMALTTMSVSSGLPCVYGVLTPDTEQQALDRAGGIHGNKGIEAAVTAVRMAALKKQLSKQRQSIGYGR